MDFLEGGEVATCFSEGSNSKVQESCIMWFLECTHASNPVFFTMPCIVQVQQVEALTYMYMYVNMVMQ